MEIVLYRTAEWAQARALETGQSVERSHTYQIPETAIPPDERSWYCVEGKYLLRVSALDDSTGLPSLYDRSCGIPGDLPDDATPEQVLAAMRTAIQAAMASALERRATERDGVHARLRAYVAQSAADRIDHGRTWDLSAAPHAEGVPAELWDAYRQAVTEAYAEIARQNRERQEAEAEEEAKQVAAAARKHSQLAEAVDRLGTESQRARWADGFLPIAEAIALIEDEALAALRESGFDVGASDRYHIDHEDIDHTDECDAQEYGEDGAKMDETEKRALDNEQYALLTRVRSLAPEGATVDPWIQTASCQSCKAKTQQFLVRATWTVGEIKINTDILE